MSNLILHREAMITEIEPVVDITSSLVVDIVSIINDKHKDIFKKEQLKKESELLNLCPFCKGKAEFTTDKSHNLIIQHLPELGVICPARFYQVCDTFEMGRSWWNKR